MSNWANTFGGTVDESNVVAGYTWGVGDQTLTGTNEGLADSADAPVAGSFWYGTFGGQQPALSAVAAGVTVPGVGVGVGLPVSNTVECSVQTFELCANNGIKKTHSFTPVDENGDPINAKGANLVFVIEREDGSDVETGPAIQNPAGTEPEYQIRFQASDAHAVAGVYHWAVREQTNNAPIAYGKLIVSYVPIAGDRTFSQEPAPVGNELARLCESITALEDLLNSGAVQVVQDGQTVAFDRQDARKQLRQLMDRKAALQAAEAGTARPKKRRPVYSRIDLGGC